MDIFPLWLTTALLLVLPIGTGFVLIKTWRLYKVTRISLCIAFSLTCLISIPLLVLAPSYLSDPFEGPGIWSFFAVPAFLIEIALLMIAAAVISAKTRKRTSQQEHR